MKTTFMPTRFVMTLFALALLLPVLAAMAPAALAQDASPAASPVEVNTDVSGTIEVAMVGNPQMNTLNELLPAFNEIYPNVTVNMTIVPENEVRQIITQDISTEAGQFDVVTIGTFEVPLWAESGWLEEVGEEAAADPNYNLDDIFQAHIDGLSYDGGLYGLPFYGESSMTFYRTDVFEEAGIEMPERPTWDQIAEYARQVHNPDEEMYGICLRGLPGWGQQLAPLTTVINAFGGRWYDEDWNAQLNSEQSAGAIDFYINLLKDAGEPAPEQAGFTECQTLFNQGQVAMWYDATSAAELISDPDLSTVAEDVGYAYAPTQVGQTNWLWNWSFAMASTSEEKEASLAFMTWATSNQYLDTVVAERGWGEAPTGARESTYVNESYLEFAGDFADIVKNSIEAANPSQPTVDPVPYQGGQFVRIPEFQALGDQVSQEFAAAMVDQQSIQEAIDQANQLANDTAELGGYQS
ncbi:MAG: ABC transporter substrate-binding protein [Thermomicrobiales bacterium]